MTLDGRNRYLACLRKGIEPRFVDYHGPIRSGWSSRSTSSAVISTQASVQYSRARSTNLAYVELVAAVSLSHSSFAFWRS